MSESELDKLYAARYRWLRQQADAQTLMDKGGWFFRNQPSIGLVADPELLDAAIDRAMIEEGEE